MWCLWGRILHWIQSSNSLLLIQIKILHFGTPKKNQNTQIIVFGARKSEVSFYFAMTQGQKLIEIPNVIRDLAPKIAKLIEIIEISLEIDEI